MFRTCIDRAGPPCYVPAAENISRGDYGLMVAAGGCLAREILLSGSSCRLICQVGYHLVAGECFVHAARMDCRPT